MKSFLTVIGIVATAAVVSGLATNNSRLRIIGGADTSILEHPYQVAIETEGNTLFCGGSILSSKVILTAAHCFCIPDYCRSTEETYIVRIGSSYREDKGQLYRFNWEHLSVHPNYGEEHKYDYDAAIIKLDREIQFNLSAAPIPLIEIGEDIEDGTGLIVTGYGFSSLGGEIPKRLQVARMMKRNRAACDSFDTGITDRMLCVGKGIPTTFHGDSGGPLINEAGQLVGIVSWGKEIPSETDPAVFTKIGHSGIHKFIDNHLSG